MILNPADKNEKTVFIENEIKTLLEVLPLKNFSKHNSGFDVYKGRAFEYLVENEKNRFYKAFNLINKYSPQGPCQIADLGTLVPYLPALLSHQHQVTIVENFKLYDQEFQGAVQRYADKFKLSLVNADILDNNLPKIGQFDVILLTAVVEHLNGSPRNLLSHIHEMLKGPKLFIFEVPNIAELGRRFSLLLGKSPLPDYEQYFTSEYPYYGHNREMTYDEVKLLMKKSGFEILHIECYDYFINNKGFKQIFINFLKKVFKKSHIHQSILVVAKAIDEQCAV